MIIQKKGFHTNSLWKKFMYKYNIDPRRKTHTIQKSCDEKDFIKLCRYYKVLYVVYVWVD